ncbi:hypothetical protein PVAG01_09655 [Phlyctema vagabunda]|uniref:ubiquitinyl hydrolase 1 n=1 Tax=Phlyctema vagabunda TaxID=108571 RepID=A0ABR4P7Z1_9HELO
MSASDRLLYMIHHVFLPPQLPQEDDSSSDLDHALAEQCEAALELFRTHLPTEQHLKWATCTKMLGNTLTLRTRNGDLMAERMEHALVQMEINGVLALHLRGQNAGLIIRKSLENVSFESFELSPTNKSVMSTKGRLRRYFPGPAIALTHERFNDPSFREALTQILTSLDVNTPLETLPVVRKAQSESPENRDTVHPKFVTEMLTGILRAVGQPYDTVRIHKRTREEVLWYNTYEPWHRSPFWLLLRVALQTSLLVDQDTHRDYKSFMIFFMAHILERALRESAPSETLFVMTAKISKRMLKLALEDQEPWMQYVHKVVEAVQQELVSRWRSMDDPDPLGLQKAWKIALPRLSFSSDTALSLATLQPYLGLIKTREGVPSRTGQFNEVCLPRIDANDQTYPLLYRSVSGTDISTRLSLLDLESWTACPLLAGLINKYVMTAAPVYAQNPEGTSLMLLTIMELWVALDKCATESYPILKNYDSGFTFSIFNVLLLPKRNQMERLSRVEQHIQRRRNASRHVSSFVFENTTKAHSLAVQYFEQSRHHQDLKLKIETAATERRTAKQQELISKRKQHGDLLQDSNSLNHEYTTYISRRGNTLQRHANYCRKCRLEQEAEALEILVHEWPLPYQTLEAKSAVFELDVPEAIAKWRDTTFTLIVDVFSPPRKDQGDSNSNMYSMRSYEGLIEFVRGTTPRLQLLSETKPFTVAHYRSRKIPQATSENICVNNGLRYSIYDSESNQRTAKLLNRCDVRKICTFQLPPKSFQSLQYALDGTTHSSNEVIANQCDCPRAINLHEFYAFATLRSGHRLQWRNIARELTTRILNFSCEETYMLVVQAALQAGPSHGTRVLRDSHIDLEEEAFGKSILSALEDALHNVKANWQGAVALQTFVALATRLLSLSPHREIHQQCYSFLQRARHVALQWARELGQLLQECNAEELSTLNQRALEVALICHGTFDADDVHISEVLQSSEDVAVIIESFIIIHDRCPAAIDGLTGFAKTLLRRFERSSHLLEPLIRTHILHDQTGIDSAIQRVWAGYRPGTRWTALSGPNERWIMSRTYADKGYSSLCVHYNVLDGSLLVEGLPLTRLPRSYELHPTYRRILGTKFLDVAPSTMPGMIFETRNNFYGQQLHFRMHDSELIIRSRRQQQICEVIPVTALVGDFPTALVQEYVHWLDVDTQAIEWRPVKEMWNSLPNNWYMHKDHDQYHLSCYTKKLLDIRSPTVNAISNLLSPLELPIHIHVVLNLKTNGLEIHLPRMKLDFYLKDTASSVESKQFRGMVVDNCQSFGALTGLVNKLVLRDIGGLSRCVVVPQGHISFRPNGHHVKVSCDTTPATHVKYHSYQIDNKLGRLVDNGSLQSRLFRLYLHATTSHCLADRLTGRTGTEEALYGLNGAATKSFVTLEPEVIELLEKLASLAPQREFYPEHLRVMQKVQWNTLSPLAQNSSFYTQVVSIMDHAKCLMVFQEKPTQIIDFKTRNNDFLLERAAIRDSSFQVSNFGAENFTTEADMVYNARDQPIDNQREQQTYCIASLVDGWSQQLKICPQLLNLIESWPGTLLGPQTSDKPTLGFDLEWLEKPSKCLREYWCTLHDMLSETVMRTDKYKVMVMLATLSYSEHANQELVQTLLAFATVSELRQLRPPHHNDFELENGYSPDEQKLICMIKEEVLDFQSCPESSLPGHAEEEYGVMQERRRLAYESAIAEHVEAFAQDLTGQGSTAAVRRPVKNHSTYVKVEEAMKRVRPWFSVWHRNFQFRTYIQNTQAILNRLVPTSQNLEQYSFSPPPDLYSPKKSFVAFSDLTNQPSPYIPHTDRGTIKALEALSVQENRGTADIDKLRGLLDCISSQYTATHEQRYVDDLRQSFEALKSDVAVASRPVIKVHVLEEELKGAVHDMKEIYRVICGCLATGTLSIVRKAKMLPRLSTTAILSHLADDKSPDLPQAWRRLLVNYGLSITKVQRTERLLAAAKNPAEFLRELENPGHEDWDPMQYPEWLILEIENNISIRREQIQISREMMIPSSGSNSVMQLNMGLGKSSVIVPIAAAALADKTQLVRVVVLKPLAMQMFQLLVTKLGGMINRRIVYAPISRSLNMNANQARQIRMIYEECKQAGSILLLQPEHILSFELMGLEQVYANSELGNVMVETQRWLYSYSRDILDESDEILSVRFELIYTMGLQRSIDLGPERWAITQYVLGVLDRVAPQVHKRFPRGLEIIPTRPGSFSHLRILQDEAGDELLLFVSRQLCEIGLPGIKVWKGKEDLLKFITSPDLGDTSAQSLPDFLSDSESMKKRVLLLKGLFAYGILKFAFGRKRWRVNYGLDPSRTMLAVPYHAKDNPAARAEFSHPDATIVLTCLSYYYGGLSDEQIHASFEALLQSDQAQEEYERWVRDAPALPSHFRRLTGVNLSNSGQCAREVFPPLRFAKSVVDFYMAAIVFPTEMKEFPDKLSSSGWDIAQEKTRPTTGFSGTNDSRYLLPLSIQQCDLPAQLSTNAAVLACLLRPENTFEDIKRHSNTGTLNAEVLLNMAIKLDPPVRVVLDVGAQVLELQNEEFAKDWLSRTPKADAQAVIFFDASNDICVLSRSGVKEPFLISPFAKQMDQCLVYLDESHTRGTDFKLPNNYRAIVTLGPGLTKDRLVQACMRMRKLGKGQSVVLCSSMEVQLKILEYRGNSEDPIEMHDVLAWCIATTCAYTKNCIPLWATQGVRHQNRQTKYQGSSITAELVKSLLEPEAQSLRQRYGNEVPQHEAEILRGVSSGTPSPREKQLNDIRAKCREFEVTSFNTATLQEEQERELSPENEREQQVELPQKLKPCTHIVHKDVKHFIEHGVLNRRSDAFRPAFQVFHNTTASSFYEAEAWPGDLLITTDFAKTVSVDKRQSRDHYLRPVNWIVSSTSSKGIQCVILSPHEAHELLPLIRQHQRVILHVYSPRLSLSVRSLDDLSFCAIPPIPKSWSIPLITRQLNLFAGQLYVQSYEEYVSLCGFLGLCSSLPTDDMEVKSDGFISPASRARSDSILVQDSPFQTSPVPFVNALTTIRRKGQSITVSHMGKILNGELITADEFQENPVDSSE